MLIITHWNNLLKKSGKYSWKRSLQLLSPIHSSIQLEWSASVLFSPIPLTVGSWPKPPISSSFLKKFYLFIWLRRVLAVVWGFFVAPCGLSCPAACGLLVPRPGIKPTSPALEGGLLTTGRPGKSPTIFSHLDKSNVHFQALSHWNVRLYVTLPLFLLYFIVVKIYIAFTTLNKF